MNQETIHQMRASLRSEGAASFTDAGGRTVVLALSGLLGVKGKGRLVIAYEGRGCMFFDGQRPLNSYRLLSAGFSSDVAAYVADIVNKIVFEGSTGDTMAKALD